MRIAAYGPHAANVVGLTDQTDLFYTIKPPWAEITRRPAVNFRAGWFFCVSNQT
ncbi:hypothetical protein ACNKHK_01395 [Shigella flexneri]